MLVVVLDVHRLRLLLEFEQRGTIAATAAALGYTPSAVSQQLAALEREAGAALLDRTPRAAELTEAGRRLAARAAEILALIEAAEADLADPEPAGRVAISALPRAGVAVADDWSGRLASDQPAFRFYPLITDPLVLVVPRGHWAAELREPLALHQ